MRFDRRKSQTNHSQAPSSVATIAASFETKGNFGDQGALALSPLPPGDGLGVREREQARGARSGRDGVPNHPPHGETWDKKWSVSNNAGFADGNGDAA